MPFITAFLILTYVYQFLSKAIKYKSNAGLKISVNILQFFMTYKIEFVISLILLMLILNKTLLPSNLVLNLASLFVNSLSVAGINLDSFFRFYLGFRFELFSTFVVWVIQFFFLFLVIRAIGSFFRKSKV